MMEPLLGDDDLDMFEATFRVLMLRKLMRKLHGPSTSSVSTPTWIAAYVIPLLAALVAGWSGSAVHGVRLHLGLPDATLACIACAITSCTVVNAAAHIDVIWRWCTYWLYLAVLFLIMTHDVAKLTPPDDGLPPASHRAQQLRWQPGGRDGAR